jgi:transposase-like protein
MSGGVRSQKRSQWRERLRRFARSKLAVAEFCRREQVSRPSFYQWRRKLADSLPAGPARRSTADANFVPVQVVPATGLQVDFPNGVRLTVPPSDPELVKLSIETIAQARTTPGDA